MATKNYRNIIDSRLEEYRVKKEQLESRKQEIKVIENKLASLKRVASIFKKSAVSSQSYLSEYLTALVTDSIKVVFPDRNLVFKVDFSTNRDTQCNISLEEDGKKLSLFDSEGYGVLDIISIVLRAAYIILDKSEKIMILDEPFRNLSVDRHEAASQMLCDLSHRLRMQIIINTHLIGIEDIADKTILIKRNQNGLYKQGRPETDASGHQEQEAQSTAAVQAVLSWGKPKIHEAH